MSCITRSRWMLCSAVLASSCVLDGCMVVGATALGVGGSTAVSHTMNGITYRTFSLPSAKVKSSTLLALNKMGIKLLSTEKEANTEILRAKTADRDIEIQLEPISSNTTRMRVTAKDGGVFYDSATATEIILQTERVLGYTA